MGADGSLFAIRHSLTRQVSDYLIDEMFVSLSILCDGHRVVRAGDVMELAATAPAEEFCRKSCIVCQTFNLHRRLWMHFGQLDRLTSYKYVCHKLLRWFSGISLALGTACRVLAVAATGYAEVVAGCFCLVPRWHWPVGGVGRNCLRVFGQIATAFAGTALRMWYLIRGVDFQVWTPAQFVRQRADGA